MLCQLAQSDLDHSSVATKSQQLMDAFLEFGSGTDDNMNCYRHIEYGKVDGLPCGPQSIYGLKIKGKKILLSDVFNMVEDLDLPAQISAQMPSLTTDEWNAITRMATMLVIAFEHHDAQRERELRDT